jgi:hypothetical protein
LLETGCCGLLRKKRLLSVVLPPCRATRSDNQQHSQRGNDFERAAGGRCARRRHGDELRRILRQEPPGLLRGGEVFPMRNHGDLGCSRRQVRQHLIVRAKSIPFGHHVARGTNSGHPPHILPVGSINRAEIEEAAPRELAARQDGRQMRGKRPGAARLVLKLEKTDLTAFRHPDPAGLRRVHAVLLDQGRRALGALLQRIARRPLPADHPGLRGFAVFALEDESRHLTIPG